MDSRPERLVNPVRGYAWGSRTVIASLQGRPTPSPGPEAELWVGAYPAAPSVVAATGAPLSTLITAAPAATLSPAVAARFGDRLPFLLKLLAVAAPLSLQVHPDAAQAAAGYAADEAAGVPRDDPRRRYVDPYHKPELLVAVSEFRALCGFREPVAAAGALAGLAVPPLAPAVDALRAGDLPAAVAALLATPADHVTAAVAAGGPGPGGRLLRELADRHPTDPGVLVALLLNEVTLAPGEAIFVPPGCPHVLLSGTGVELPAASDNVLRGGLTPKPVDVPELLRVLRYEVTREPVRRPVAAGPGIETWPVPAPELALHRVRLRAGAPAAELPLAGPRIVWCLSGRLRVAAAGDGLPVPLGPTEAAFVPASAGPLTVAGGGDGDAGGDGEGYIASVGDFPRAPATLRPGSDLAGNAL